eukprot:1025915-Rhodomonas_salina.1
MRKGSSVLCCHGDALCGWHIIFCGVPVQSDLDAAAVSESQATLCQHIKPVGDPNSPLLKSYLSLSRVFTDAMTHVCGGGAVEARTRTISWMHGRDHRDMTYRAYTVVFRGGYHYTFMYNYGCMLHQSEVSARGRSTHRDSASASNRAANLDAIQHFNTCGSRRKAGILSRK